MGNTARLLVQSAATVGTAAIFGLGYAHWGASAGDGLSGTIGAAIAGGVIGNFADRLMCHGSDAITRMLESAGSDELPVNHDLYRALRRAQLKALGVLAAMAVREDRQGHAEADRSAMLYDHRLAAFRTAFRRWQRRALNANAKRDWPSASPLVTMLASRLPLLLGERCAPETPHAPDLTAEGIACITELREAGIFWLPEPLRETLEGHPTGAMPAWDVAFRSFFWEEIKTETAVHRVVSLRLALSLPRRTGRWATG